MRRRVSPWILAGVLILCSHPARAVDATGTWSVSFSSFGFGCFPFTGTIVATTDFFTLTSFFFNFTGTIDPGTGMLAYPEGTGAATDTSIAGSIDYPPCFGYTFSAVRVCPACDDGDPCTTDGCDGATCIYGNVPGGMACDDGNACTSGDACRYTTSIPVESACTGTGTTCDDGNPCTDDACNPATGQCVFTPNGDACDDGNACTSNDHCSSGQCRGTPCGPCESCGPIFGCMAGPLPGCRPTRGNGKILLRNATGVERDRLAWSWGKGATTTSADFGNPPSGDGYTLCVFDRPGPSPRLLLSATAPAGGTCADGTSCWLARGNPAGSTGFTYRDSGLLDPDGVKSVKLKPGADTKARVTVKARGSRLAMPSPLAVALPVAVQLRGDNGACFGATFDTARQSRPDVFEAVSSPSGAFVDASAREGGRGLCHALFSR